MPRPGDFHDSLRSAVAEFGSVLRPKYAGNGWPEDQLRGPIEKLLRNVGPALGLSITLIGEVPLVDLESRPDYEVRVDGATVGHIELKSPGTGADPESFSGRNARQWEKLSLLPNTLISDGNSWSVHRNGQRIGPVAHMLGSVRTAGRRLEPADGALAGVLQEFLLWHPTPPRIIGQTRRQLMPTCQPRPVAVGYSAFQELITGSINFHCSSVRTFGYSLRPLIPLPDRNPNAQLAPMIQRHLIKRHQNRAPQREPHSKDQHFPDPHRNFA
jgi:hypothetical protein